ncbi:MAG: LysM peptidoglycan-binding domain-containing protein [Verrucomicrobiales bacterium]|jgi:tetratricopeptide (TPR) repeat protein|nr:LysM peptidoglycan-binding domain-containing protein [Verrucomicrobiales bacterium]
MRPYLLLLALTMPLLTAACRFGEKGTEAEDSTNPYFAQAEKFEAGENYPAAIEQYEKALQANATVAKAYEKMGDIYSEKLGDPVSAIYCYQKYLKARPNADDKDLVTNYIEKARHDFALTLPPAAPVAGDPAPGGWHTAAHVPPVGAPVAAAPVTPGETARTYLVQKGDSLWKIAGKFYPQEIRAGVEKIKQANPTVSERNLQPGATLAIP